jgi:hypothetical protein
MVDGLIKKTNGEALEEPLQKLFEANLGAMIHRFKLSIKHSHM